MRLIVSGEERARPHSAEDQARLVFTDLMFMMRKMITMIMLMKMFILMKMMMKMMMIMGKRMRR